MKVSISRQNYLRRLNPNMGRGKSPHLPCCLSLNNSETVEVHHFFNSTRISLILLKSAFFGKNSSSNQSINQHTKLSQGLNRSVGRRKFYPTAFYLQITQKVLKFITFSIYWFFITPQPIMIFIWKWDQYLNLERET